MGRIGRTLCRLVVAGMAVGALGGLGAAPAQATGASSGSVASAVNAARARAGRPPLSLRSDLSAVAYRWSQHMAATNTLRHNPNLTGQVTSWRWVGENVGYGPTAGAVETAFMNSPAHRANILDRDYSQIGVGVVVRNGRVWITQVFRSPAGTSARHTSTKKPTSPPHSAARPSPRPSPRTSTRPVRRAAAQPHPKPAPSPTELLHRRLTTARAALSAQAAASIDDPLTAALGFADAMRTVGG